MSLWLKALILPFCFVFVDKYSVLRGVAGEGEREGESNTKCHLNISPFQVYNDCVNVSLRTQHRTTCLTVCADWLPCLSSRSPPTRLSLQMNSFSPPPYYSSICLILFVTHPFFVSACLPFVCLVCLFGSFFWLVLIAQLACTQIHKHIYMNYTTSLFHCPLSFCLCPAVPFAHTHPHEHHTLTPDTGRWPIRQASCWSVSSQPQRAPSCPGWSDSEPDPQHRQHHCPHRHTLPAPSMLRHSLRPDCAALLRTHQPLRAHSQNENDNLHHLTSHPKVIHTVEDKNKSLVSNAWRQALIEMSWYVNDIVIRQMMAINEQGSNFGVHSIAKLFAGNKCTSFRNVYIPGILPVDYVCNDAFLPLEGVVSLFRGN